MKNTVICLFTFISVGFFSLQCTTKNQSDSTGHTAQQAPPTTNDLPALAVRITDGQAISLREVTGKVVLIFFNPDCDHCQREAEQIKNRKQLFYEYQVYFISTETVEALNGFAKKYELMDDNFLFAQADAAAVFESVGNLPSVPAIFIYDNKRFVKRFDGETSLDVIQQFL